MVDVDANKNLKVKFEIKSYPTLRLFVNGQKNRQVSGRTKKEIVSFVKKITGPPVERINCKELGKKVKKLSG